MLEQSFQNQSITDGIQPHSPQSLKQRILGRKFRQRRINTLPCIHIFCYVGFGPDKRSLGRDVNKTRKQMYTSDVDVRCGLQM